MQFLKLLLIRHAESTGNLERRMQGQAEYPLSDRGRSQALKLAHALLKEKWYPTHVYSSPLQRTAETTQILLEALQAHRPAFISDLTNTPDDEPSLSDQNIFVEYTPLLKELHNGIFQGLTWAEAKVQYPQLCAELEASPDWIAVPEAESLMELRSRAHVFISQMFAQHNNGDHLWIVTHSGFLPHLIAEVLGVDRSWRIASYNTALFEFWIDRSRWLLDNENRYNTDLWQIRRFNDYRHLH